MTLDELYQIILCRQQTIPADSYVAGLLRSGTDRVIQKVGEEAVEVVIAAKNNDRDQLISETADLLFHTLVMLADRDVSLNDIYEELASRK
jgi:phosphoribosyl-ATP pyrophosphohydrolase